jgi:CRISPR-associated protein Csx10
MNQILEIEFLSDWHVGSGAGIPGSVDMTVLKDADGIPYVPGRTITGMLRDSAAFIAGARDNAEGGTKWMEAFKSLFGGRQTQGEKIMPAKIGIGNAVFSEELKNILKYHEGLRQALFIVQPGIKINRETGRAKDDHLFFREEVRGGCTLRANIHSEITLPEEERLLKDAVRATQRIGGHRRRGGGRCSINLKDVDSHRDEQNTSSPREQTFDFNYLNNDTLELEYVLETLQPVIINRVTLGNEAQSERFIPGTALLPFFHKKMSSADDLSKAIGEAIGKGEFSVGSFYPEVWNSLTYPVPFSYSGEKENPSVVINRLTTKPQDNDIQMKDIRSEYVAPNEDGTSVRLSSGKKLMIYRTHNAVDDEKQRPTESSGGPYTFQAIDAGKKFRGTIRLSGDFWKKLQDKDKFINSLTRERNTSIGLSKKDEYGGVKITFAGIHRAQPDFSDLLKGKGKYLEKKYIVACLISDTLVRNKDTLAFTGSIDDFRDALADTLHISLKNVDFDDTNPLGGDRGNCVRFDRRESWHSKWALPRPSLVYLQAGSVFLFEAENFNACNFDWNAAQKKLFQGIGDRRAEGYGRVLLNPGFLCDCNVEISRSTDNDDRQHANSGYTEEQCALNGVNELETLSENDQYFFSRLKNEHIKAAFTKSARRIIADFVWNDNDDLGLFENVSLKEGTGAPSSSQFGVLREIAAAISEAGNVTPVMSLFNAQTSRSQFTTRIWSKNWIVWLENVTGGAVDLWGVITNDTVLDDEIRQDMAVFAVSTFLDIFCETVFDKFSKGGNI